MNKTQHDDIFDEYFDEKIFLKLFYASFTQNGLDGKLTKDQIIALTAVCRNAVLKGLEQGIKILNTMPEQNTVIDYYKSQCNLEIEVISADTDMSKPYVDFEQQGRIDFSSDMWKTVLACRVGGHFWMLDLLDHYYRSRWGISIDNAVVNKSNAKK